MLHESQYMLLFISSRVPCELVADFLDVYIYVCRRCFLLFSYIFEGPVAEAQPVASCQTASSRPTSQHARQPAARSQRPAARQPAAVEPASLPGSQQPAASQPAAGEPASQTGDHTWGRLSMWTGNAEAGGPVTSKPAPNREVRCGPVTSKHVDR